MRTLAPLALALALVGVYALWWLDPSHALEREARAAAEAARVSQAASIEMERAAALAPWITGAQVVAVLLGVALAGAAAAWGVGCLYFDLRRRVTTAMPTRDGRLPVPLSQLPAASVAALGAHHAARQLSVSDQPLRGTLTFEQELVAGLLAEPVEPR